MYSSSKLAVKYLKYIIRSSNGRGHGTHSPFVFDFIRNVLNASKPRARFQEIETLRSRLMRDQSVLQVEDFGAGSAFGSARQRPVAQIAAQAAKPAKYGRLLYRIAEHYNIPVALELGSSLGMSTAYLASAPTIKQVVTLEGSPAIAQKAKTNFGLLGLHHIEVVVGNFDDTLDSVLKSMPSPGLIFFDGNHREEPTLRYFRQGLMVKRDASIFIFDDIHWSAEMESAWEQIKADPAVTCTIDLFFVGIVFFNPAFKEKQHFEIRY